MKSESVTLPKKDVNGLLIKIIFLQCTYAQNAPQICKKKMISKINIIVLLTIYIYMSFLNYFSVIFASIDSKFDK